ncbi:MAG: aspartate aminotransferase family protein [Candidatus Izemoplasmataceae bacterium]
MLAEDQNYIINTYQRSPIEIAYGKGSYLTDIQGNCYLDMFSGIAVNALGHQHPKINEVLVNQAKNYLHLSNVFTSPPVIGLAKRLVKNSFASKVFFANSGTEANEAALKLARKWGKTISENKTEILALHQAFHGRSSGGMALTGKAEYKTQFAPILPGITHIPRNDNRALKQAMHHNVCAIFLEMIQGEGGVQVLDQTYVDELVVLSKEYNVLIVVDEIQTGLMRTGKLFAYEHFGFEPDMVTLAKALGGGLPIGALLVNKSLENVFSYGDHGSTFGGNPLACALGEVVMDEILDGPFVKSMNDNMIFLFESLIAIKNTYPSSIIEVRGLGFMIGIEVGNLAPIYKERMLTKNILINVTNKTVIRLLPALNINRDEISHFIQTFKEVTEAIIKEEV